MQFLTLFLALSQTAVKGRCLLGFGDARPHVSFVDSDTSGSLVAGKGNASPGGTPKAKDTLGRRSSAGRPGGRGDVFGRWTWDVSSDGPAFLVDSYMYAPSCCRLDQAVCIGDGSAGPQYCPIGHVKASRVVAVAAVQGSLGIWRRCFLFPPSACLVSSHLPNGRRERGGGLVLAPASGRGNDRSIMVGDGTMASFSRISHACTKYTLKQGPDHGVSVTRILLVSVGGGLVRMERRGNATHGYAWGRRGMV